MITSRMLYRVLALCCVCSLVACYPGYDPRTPAYPQARATVARSPLFIAEVSSRAPRPLTFGREPTPTANQRVPRFEYLPRQAQKAARRLREGAQVVIQSQAVQVALANLKEPMMLSADLEPGSRDVITTFVLTNTGASAIELDLPKLFHGMNSSGHRLDQGGKIWLTGPSKVTVPAKGQSSVDLAWRTEVYEEDMRLWITVNMPIQESGYVQPTAEGAIFAFGLAEVRQQGVEAKACERAAKFVRETVEDDTVFKPGERFTKTWVIANSGDCNWIENSVWAHFSGEPMGVTRPLALTHAAGTGTALDGDGADDRTAHPWHLSGRLATARPLWRVLQSRVLLADRSAVASGAGCCKEKQAGERIRSPACCMLLLEEAQATMLAHIVVHLFFPALLLRQLVQRLKDILRDLGRVARVLIGRLEHDRSP